MHRYRVQFQAIDRKARRLSDDERRLDNQRLHLHLNGLSVHILDHSGPVHSF